MGSHGKLSLLPLKEHMPLQEIKHERKQWCANQNKPFTFLTDYVLGEEQTIEEELRPSFLQFLKTTTFPLDEKEIQF